jgi:four helix bundle protein
MTRFEALELAVELVTALRSTLNAVQRRDRDLHSQLRRAAMSVPSCVAEGAERRGQDRLHLYRVAAGSLAELCVQLRIARAWGYVASSDAASIDALADRLAAILYRLTHPRA